MRDQGDIGWEEDGTPYSIQFDDVYFSKGSGPAEAEHVFLKPNQIEHHLKKGGTLNVAELGFGTGLNFMMTWNLHQRIAAVVDLHFFSVEKYPLNPEQLFKAHRSWPALKPFSQTLLAETPFEAGWNHLTFGNVHLHLYVGDVLTFLTEMLDDQMTLQAWYLDGFAPSKNPDMWSENVLGKVAELTEPQGTLSTYTAVGQVRRDLVASGFHVEKIEGYGRKREMLFGKKS